MYSLKEMIYAAVPFALTFMVVGGTAAWIILSLIRRRTISPLLVWVSALYVGFLLHGTCISRIDGWEELLEWQSVDWNTIWWEFELGRKTRMSALHALFNIALFVPWGFLGMCYQRRGWAGWLVLLSGIAMSAGIELFQLTHGLVFDMGDLLTNSIGTMIGCILGIPVMLINGWRFNRRKRKEKQKEQKRKT